MDIQEQRTTGQPFDRHIKKAFNNQRFVFGIIAFLGAASFVLTYVSFSARIGGTGTSDGSSQNQIDQFNQLLAAPFGSTAGSDTTDTDKDGLSDTQELSFYRTSPYIADTDGDGKSDGDEVKEGKDPTCAEGKNCKQVPITVEQPKEEDLEKLGQIAADLGKQIEGQQGEDTGAQAEPTAQDLSNLSAKEIRDLLLQSGKMTEVQLSKIDDETLMRVYAEVIKK